MGFLSTPSARRATANYPVFRLRCCDFYPRPPRGGRPGRPETRLPCGRFLSTPSARRATADNKERESMSEFLSTPSARRATASAASAGRLKQISIHALREEGDRRPQQNRQ